jgi:hypothetical protein
MQMLNKIPCQVIKCKDCLADGGPPAWCFSLGMPAEVAMKKCPKLQEQEPASDNEKLED